MTDSPSPAEAERMDLPEEIERAIAAFGLAAFADGRNGDCQALEDQARQALTTAILSRLSAAEAGREEAERKWAEANALLTKLLAQAEGDQ
ncbi:hypothetical protein [Methylobacterium fujisawaense]|uniref:hypothetical protein n=1 Tax=Methylobacterium fujisawaense TaxID=107400 RepID=UPI00313B4B5D